MQLGWSYNKAACRLHALVADPVPGGISKEVVVRQARSLLDGHCPVGAVAIERHQLAVDLVDELDRLTGQRTVLRSRIRTAVAASGTVGPAHGIVVLGYRLLPRLYDRLVGPLARIAVFARDTLLPTEGNVFVPLRPNRPDDHPANAVPDGTAAGGPPTGAVL